MKKILILYNSMAYSIEQLSNLSDDHVDIYASYNNVSKGKRILRKIQWKFNCYSPYWLNDWNKKLQQYDLIVVFAGRDINLVTYISQNSHCRQRLIYWYWNISSICTPPHIVKEMRFETWSFDRMECDKYQMKFNSTFFVRYNNLIEDKIAYDACFIGIDKQRKKIIEEISQTLASLGFTTFKYIISADDPKRLPQLTYNEYLAITLRSKVILDLLQEGQSGMTVRVMESLIYKKKLITNNIGIKKEPFYNSQNIFVWGVDDINSLSNVIMSSYADVDDDIVEYYSFKNWLERFDLQ